MRRSRRVLGLIAVLSLTLSVMTTPVAAAPAGGVIAMASSGCKTAGYTINFHIHNRNNAYNVYGSVRLTKYFCWNGSFTAWGTQGATITFPGLHSLSKYWENMHLSTYDRKVTNDWTLAYGPCGNHRIQQRLQIDDDFGLTNIEWQQGGFCVQDELIIDSITNHQP